MPGPAWQIHRAGWASKASTGVCVGWAWTRFPWSPGQGPRVNTGGHGSPGLSVPPALHIVLGLSIVSCSPWGLTWFRTTQVGWL